MITHIYMLECNRGMGAQALALTEANLKNDPSIKAFLFARSSVVLLMISLNHSCERDNNNDINSPSTRS